jgi:SLT domain-containing protein
LRLTTTVRLYENMQADTASGHAGPPDSRSADEWIKDYLDKKNKKLNDMRQELLRTVDPMIRAAYQEGKYVDEQDIYKIAEGGRWAVMSPDGLILSTHHERGDAEVASDAKRYAQVVDLGPEYEYRRKGPLGRRKPSTVSYVDALLNRDIVDLTHIRDRGATR